MSYTVGMSGSEARGDVLARAMRVPMRAMRVLVSRQRILYMLIIVVGSIQVVVGAGMFALGGSDWGYIAQGGAFILIGVLGWVMSLTNEDIGAGIRKSVADEGAKTREANAAEGAKTREANAAEGAKTRDVIVGESAKTREVLITINDTLVAMGDAMRPNWAGGAPPGGAGPRAPPPG